MKKQEICARHYASRHTVCLRWHDGRITHYEPVVERQRPGWWLAPGLVDLQVNGFGGVDFQRDGLGVEDLLRATRALRAAGCTRFLLTLVTAPWDELVARLQHLRALREQSAELKAAIAGWHLEGPFLSGVPGFHGAHDPALMLDPRPAQVHRLRAITEEDRVLLTLAPERDGAIEAIALAVSLGMSVSLGHTDASWVTLEQAVAAGAIGFTHLGNACPQALDRHDNVLWRVFETPGLTISLIPDGLHVSPPLFRLIHRVLPLQNIVYTSDAMAAAGAPAGRYTLGRLELEVGADGVVRQPGATNFAGSALRPVDGVFRAAEMVGIGWQETWRRLSVAAAELVGLPCSLADGQPADFCLLKVTPDGQLAELRVFAAGQEFEPSS